MDRPDPFSAVGASGAWVGLQWSRSDGVCGGDCGGGCCGVGMVQEVWAAGGRGLEGEVRSVATIDAEFDGASPSAPLGRDIVGWDDPGFRSAPPRAIAVRRVAAGAGRCDVGRGVSSQGLETWDWELGTCNPPGEGTRPSAWGHVAFSMGGTRPSDSSGGGRIFVRIGIWSAKSGL